MILSISLNSYSQDFPPFPERHRRLVQSISFSPDGKEMYFTLAHREYLEAQGKAITDAIPRLVIYSARIESNGWSEPKIISFGGKYKEYEPSVSPDGNLMFFNSNRPLHGSVPFEKNNIWFSRKTDGKWGEPEYIPAINTQEFEESYATITRNGQLFFVGETPVGDKFQYSIYTTRFNGTSTEPAKRVIDIDYPQGSADPWVAADGSYIIFTKFTENWNETCDLHISFKKGNSWSNPVKLEELNSEGPDFAVAISPDQKWIYYRKNYQFLKVPFLPILEKYR